jgi:hypothetical protein
MKSYEDGWVRASLFEDDASLKLPASSDPALSMSSAELLLNPDEEDSSAPASAPCTTPRAQTGIQAVPLESSVYSDSSVNIRKELLARIGATYTCNMGDAEKTKA